MQTDHVCSSCPEYTEVLSGLYLGTINACTKDIFHSLGVTHVLSLLTGAGEVAKGKQRLHGATHLSIALDDVNECNLLAEWATCYKFLKEAQESSDAVVMVHCVHGQSRSAAIIAMYLMKERGLPAQGAVEMLIGVRPCIAINAGFLRQLQLYERLLQSKATPTPALATYNLFRHAFSRLAAGYECGGFGGEECDLFTVPPDNDEFDFREEAEEVSDAGSECSDNSRESCQESAEKSDDGDCSEAGTDCVSDGESDNSEASERDERDQEALSTPEYVTATAGDTETNTDQISCDYRCIKCNHLLAQSHNTLLTHYPEHNDVQVGHNSESESRSHDEDTQKCNCLYTEVLPWLDVNEVVMTRQTHLKVRCPNKRCHTRVGVVSWKEPIFCDCGAECAPCVVLYRQNLRVIPKLT